MFIVYYNFFFCVFFVFKQKTAYELRISDWSSDVCSSDLVLAEPGDAGGRADRRGLPHASEGVPRGGQAPCARDAEGGAHPRPGARRPRLSARGFRRHGTAHHDRHDADPRSRPADRRRADLCARRHRAAPGAGDPRRPGDPARHGPHLHQPRPQPGGLVLRPRGHHVRWPHHGDLRRQKPRGGAAPLHPRIAELPADHRRRRPRPAGAAPRSEVVGRGTGARPVSAMPVTAMPVTAMIEVEGLNVVFGHGADRVHAVRDVSFRVPEGATFGLVGESGSGKSTVLRALSGLNPDWTGRVVIAGGQQGPRRDKAFYKLVQMVFQDPYGSLHPRHTVDRILMEPLAIHRLDNPDRRSDQVLGEVGLGSAFRFRYPHQLSGGQRQRVAIARALILEPRILLLDEPTSALDVSVQAEVLNLLQRLKQERGLTYVLVSHYLAVIAHMCDAPSVMNPRAGEIGR